MRLGSGAGLSLRREEQWVLNDGNVNQKIFLETIFNKIYNIERLTFTLIKFCFLNTYFLSFYHKFKAVAYE